MTDIAVTISADAFLRENIQKRGGKREKRKNAIGKGKKMKKRLKKRGKGPVKG
jgi:hypothetical protein